MDLVFKTRVQSHCLQIVFDLCERRDTKENAESCAQRSTELMRQSVIEIRSGLPDEISGSPLSKRSYSIGLERLDQDLAQTDCLRFGEEYQTFCNFQRAGVMIIEAYRLGEMSNTLEMD